jgi:hypothetical protein
MMHLLIDMISDGKFPEIFITRYDQHHCGLWIRADAKIKSVLSSVTLKWRNTNNWRM